VLRSAAAADVLVDTAVRATSIRHQRARQCLPLRIDDLSDDRRNVDERGRRAVRARDASGRGRGVAARFRSLDVVPTIVAIREKVEAIRQVELEKGSRACRSGPRHRRSSRADLVDRQQICTRRSRRERQGDDGRRTWSERPRLFDLAPPVGPDEES